MLGVVRASSLPSLPDCNRRWIARHRSKLVAKKKYTLRETKPSAGAALGTAYHAGAAHILRKLQAEPGGISLEDFEEAYSVSMVAFLDQVAGGKIEWDPTTPRMFEAEQQLRAMLSAGLPELMAMEPLYIEHKLSAPVPELGLEIEGTTDLITRGGFIWDHKSGARPPSPQAQNGLYRMMARANGIPVGDETGMIYIPRRKAGKPIAAEVVKFDGYECDRAAWSALEQIASLVTKFEDSGDCWDLPANPMSQLCTPRYCPAWGTDMCSMGKPVKELTT